MASRKVRPACCDPWGPPYTSPCVGPRFGVGPRRGTPGPRRAAVHADGPGRPLAWRPAAKAARAHGVRPATLRFGGWRHCGRVRPDSSRLSGPRAAGARQATATWWGAIASAALASDRDRGGTVSAGCSGADGDAHLLAARRSSSRPPTPHATRREGSSSSSVTFVGAEGRGSKAERGSVEGRVGRARRIEGRSPPRTRRPWMLHSDSSGIGRVAGWGKLPRPIPERVTRPRV